MINKNILAKNLEAIKSTSPFTYKWLDQNFDVLSHLDKKIIKNNKNMWDFRNKNGLMIEGFPLTHYFSWPLGEDIGIYVIVGTNIGYGLALLLEKTPSYSKIIVCEPNPEMVLATLALADYSFFIKKGKIVFLPPDIDFISDFFDNLTPLLRHLKIKLYIDPPSSKMNDMYIHFGQTIQNVIDDKLIVLNTVLNNQKTFITNELLNFANVFKDRTLIHLIGKKRDIVAIILGAGPSLEKFLPNLKKFKENFIVATSFQTLPVCFIKNFQPHLCMAIDPTKILMQVYSKVTEKFLKQIFFIYSPKINPKVVEKYPGNRYSIWTKGGIGSDIKNTCDVILDAGGNVSISLIRLLYLIGIRKFVLVGQDFAWKGTRTHSNGHHGSNNHIQFDPNKYIELKNIYGETIYSSKAYLAAARELESDIRKYNLEVYNLYGGGINISGTKNIKIEDLGLIADNKNKSELEELLSDLKSQKTQRTYIPRISFESKQWISSLNSFQKRLDKLYKKPNINTNKIRSAYNELHIFLTQHPLYKYCIYNEVLELSRYVFIQEKYDLSDLAYTKKIINDIKKQLPKIDKILKEQLTKIKDHFTEINDVCNRHIAA